MAEFILLNRAILNANGDFKLAIKNIDNIPGGNLPTPTRNLLNEFKNAVKEIEKRVVKADNQPNLANQANSGNIDSLTKQISYLQNAIKNSTKDAPTPSTATKEADSLSQATPNLVSDGVVSETDARNLAKNISLNKDIAIQLQPKADLLKLVKDFSNVIKTPIFESKISIDKLLNHLADKTDADKRLEYLNLIKPTLENPLFITRENNRYRFVKTFIDSDKITKFLSVIENDKGEFIGITATPIKNTDLKNLLKGNIVWGGDTLSTLSTPQIAKREVEAISETIPNQTIKQAETTAKTTKPQTTKAKEPKAEPIATAAKDPTADAPSELYKAHRKAQKAKEALKPQEPMATTAKETQEPQAKSEPIATQTTKTKATTKAEPTQETFDILKIDKNISDEQVERLLKEIEDKNLKVNLPLRDDEALGKAFQKDELGYGRKRLLNLALNEQFLKRHKGFIERAEKTQSKAEFQKFLKENKAEVVEYIKDMVTNTLRYIDSYGEGYHFTNKSSLRRANEMILNLQNGKNFYFYNHAPNKITNPAPKSDYADKLIDGNEAIQGTYKISDEIKQDLIKSLKEFVGSRQNLAENIANIQSRWWHKIKEQERLAPSILEGGKKANNGYDENLKKALEHEVYLFNQFERKIVKNPQKTSSDLELANNYYRFSKGDTYTKKALDEINQTRQILEQELNIQPIKEFGTNYAEFYHDGANAIKKLLTERQGQVAGAFYKDGLGDIDLVWGNDKIGLNKIILKHSDDFKSFGGIENGLNEIITNGKIINENGVDTIWYKKGNDYYVVGLSKGFNGTRNNNWVITSYKKSTGYIPNEVKGDTANLSAYSGKFKGELTSPHPPLTNTETIPNQNINQAETAKAQKAGQYAKWLSQADKIAPQAPDELYKAYDKAKRT
ncbi:PBECR2 nuclease fold domain-containing protein [Campylobacter lanienae]|uniref:putative barnase/colicin E5 family endoribonuclease n=1 Tax=Campylobacter lanienae TaxID=75658 RepID=UPI00242ED89B|nr:PBECR2 nuclease fold domain-containing protein [Campylobacter lanienae]